MVTKRKSKLSEVIKISENLQIHNFENQAIKLIYRLQYDKKIIYDVNDTLALGFNGDSKN